MRCALHPPGKNAASPDDAGKAPGMFTHSTAFYDKLYAARGKDYVAEATAITALIRERVPSAKTFLDVGCGTGSHLAAFAALGFDVRGIDADLKMVALARSRVPHLTVDPADMTDFDIGSRFDVVVSLFGSTGYARVRARLDATIARIAAHLAPGGIALVERFLSFEEYRPGSVDSIFVDEPDLKIARMSVSKQMGKIAILDFHYLVASLTGVERYFERHEIGLFGDAAYASAFEKAGLSFECVDVPHIAPDRSLYLGTHATPASRANV